MLFRRYCLRVQDLDEPAAQSLIDAFEKDMADVDPVAMSELEGYWPVVIEQMRQGLL